MFGREGRKEEEDGPVSSLEAVQASLGCRPLLIGDDSLDSLLREVCDVEGGQFGEGRRREGKDAPQTLWWLSPKTTTARVDWELKDEGACLTISLTSSTLQGEK
jgi:hypothetical protein